MKYTFVNKNRLIPQILSFDNEKSAINELIEITNFCNNTSCLKNIYIVCESENNDYLIFNNGNNVIKLFNDKTEIINKTYSTSENMLNNLENIFTNNKKIELNIKKNIKNKMIDIHNHNNAKENTENLENNDEDNELKKSCNEVFQLYNQELLKIKKIENIIKNLEKKEEKIINIIKNDNIDKINKLYYDCNTFIKINEKVNYSVNFSVPELFLKKYNYFNNLYNTSDDFNVILKKIKDFDINNINNINDNIKIDNDLISFAKIYFDESKELNNSFDHNWDDLSVDVDGIAKAKSSSRLY
jgi:hypothetical protein